MASAHGAGARAADPVAARGRARHGADAGQHADDGEDLRIRHLLPEPREVPAGDVARLMGEDADDLVRRLGVHERADIDEDLLAVRHEGVEGAVVDQDDLGRACIDAGGLEDRQGIVAQELLGLDVAHDAGLAAPLCGRHRRGGDAAANQAPAWPAGPGREAFHPAAGRIMTPVG